MDQQYLHLLLKQKESPTLDFKRQWYLLNKDNNKVRKYARGELTRDILSLANGNADTAGETAYLIIGVEDQVGPDGKRVFHTVTDSIPAAKELLQLINANCDPSLGNLYVDPFDIDGHQLYVITIPPSPHLHETVDETETDKRVFSEHTVFIRRGEHVRVASTRERLTLMQIKQVRFSENKNAPPEKFGALVGAFIAGWMGFATGETITGAKEGKIIGAVVGAGAGGFLGRTFGQIFTYYKEIKVEWPRLSNLWRAIVLSPLIVGPVAGKLINDYWKRRLEQRRLKESGRQ